ncbi:DUF992 domain-containing protein [Rhizobium paknamense]|uniref:DUF992 domain-containing protein n=1 Tax=Rhizobium paknamense TaxID=1206817 RepID=A0ABU0IGD6_9HYPH|nr:DUF992 domain-containing protein [Rhizobium paknamense]MDQ0457226.1 hypothetical protein [Rhizobium paknamense]
MKTLMFVTAASLALAPVAAFAASSHHPHHRAPQKVVANEPKQRLGTLNCQIDGGVGMLIGSKKNVTCEFRQRSGKVERYAGSIGKLGLDVGITGKTYMSWVVVNTKPTSVGDGALAGSYVGASASASVGVGLGANALVGGNSKNFALQPLSGEAGTGLNVAAGVSRLQLKLVG